MTSHFCGASPVSKEDTALTDCLLVTRRTIDGSSKGGITLIQVIGKSPRRRAVAYDFLALMTVMTSSVTAADIDTTSAGKTALEETVIVASRVTTPLHTLGVSVSTLDREEMAALGYATLGDLFDLQPGVSVTGSGGYGKATTVRIRGEEGFRTRIQLDGIDIADPSSPQMSPRLEHLLSEGIQRVELLRGPQGLMYGADAGGVIAMTSRAPAETFSADIVIEGGANHFQRLGATLAGGNKLFDATISAAAVETHGFNAREIDDNSPDEDGYDNQTVHATLNADVSERWRTGVSLHSVDGSNEYDGCFEPSTFATINDCTDNYTQVAWRSFAAWSGDLSNVTVSYENNRIDRQFFSGDSQTFETDGEQEELSIVANIRFNPTNRLTLGADILEQSLTDEGVKKERGNSALFAEFAADALAGNIQIGIRADDNDDFGTHTSWRLSTFQPLGFERLPVAITAAIGTGFRAPSLYEIAYNKGPFSYSPAREQILKEETSQGWETGIRMGSPDHQLSATWFSQRIDDEIYFDLASYSGYLQRTGNNQSRGIEIEGRTSLGDDIALMGNLTWNETTDAEGSQRPYRPELTAAVSVIWTSDWLVTAITGRLARDAVDTLGQPMDNYGLLDTSVTADLTRSLQLSARIENITNENYQQVRGYFSAERRWYLSLRYQY